jgi:hypothetical protein
MHGERIASRLRVAHLRTSGVVSSVATILLKLERSGKLSDPSPAPTSRATAEAERGRPLSRFCHCAVESRKFRGKP